MECLIYIPVSCWMLRVENSASGPEMQGWLTYQPLLAAVSDVLCLDSKSECAVNTNAANV